MAWTDEMARYLLGSRWLIRKPSESLADIQDLLPIANNHPPSGFMQAMNQAFRPCQF